MSTPNAYQTSGIFAETEAQRLKIMDTWLTRFSAIAIGNDPQSVIDIGAGSGRSLERFVVRKGGIYIALDSTQQIIDERRRDPTSGRIILGKAHQLPKLTDLTESDQQLDIAHARALTAWLQPAQRSLCYEEMMRVAKKGIVINFDWSVNEQTHPDLRSFISFFSRILAEAGYNTMYGKEQHHEISARFRDRYKVSTQEIVDTEIGREESLIIIVGAVESVAKALFEARMITPYSMLDSGYKGALETLANSKRIWLPKLHITTIEKS